MAELPTGDEERTETAVETRSRLATASFKLGVLPFASLLVCIAISTALIISRVSRNTEDVWFAFVALSFLIFCPLAAISAIILGHTARSRIRESPVLVKGRGQALVGLALGYAYPFVILAMIAIPSSCRSRIQSNESAAIGNLRTITGAQTGYEKAHGVYAGSFAELTDDTHGPAYLLGKWDKTVPKTGYIYTLKSTDNGNCYEATADPAIPNRSGIRHFFTDCSGVIRSNAKGPADSTSTPIGE